MTRAILGGNSVLAKRIAIRGLSPASVCFISFIFLCSAAFAQERVRAGYSVVARAGLRSPQDLRGKKIGVLSVVGLNQIVVAAALRHWGMEEKSVTLVRAGGSRDRLNALQSGLIDATVLTGAFVDRARA